MSSELMNAKELHKYRNCEDKTVPDRGGHKDDTPDGSLLQSKKLENFYDELENVLAEERVERLGSVVQGHWNPKKQLVEFQKELGKFWMHMGFFDSGRKWLYPEEALYLMETNVLETFYSGIPMSIEEAYHHFFIDSTFTLEDYQVYSHLRRLGYVLKRYVITRSTEDICSSVFPDAKETATTATYIDIPPEGPSETSEITFLPYSNFSEICLPNMAGKDTVTLDAPNASLLPQSIELTKLEYTIDLMKINDDSQAKRRKRRDDNDFPDLEYSNKDFNDCKLNARNWREYKSLIQDQNNKLSEGHGASLWSGEINPLVSPNDVTSLDDIWQKLNIIPTSDYSSVSKNTSFKISYDVYLPNKKFKKSSPGSPQHRVCITKQTDSPPTLLDICSISTNDCVPLLWAIVADNGDISFMTLQPVDICHNK